METKSAEFTYTARSPLGEILSYRTGVFLVAVMGGVVLSPFVLAALSWLGWDMGWFEALSNNERFSKLTVGWAGFGLCAALVYPVPLSPQRLLQQGAPVPLLAARSAALASRALDTALASRLPKEPTLWSVTWRPNPFGLHADEMSASDVSGRAVCTWRFAELPELMRFVDWEGGQHLKKDTLLSLVTTAKLPVVTAHVRMALAHAALDSAVDVPDVGVPASPHAVVA